MDQLPKRQTTTRPQEGLLVLYIAGDTLRHQPIGVGHMTSALQIHPMEFRVTQAVNQSRQAQGGLVGVSGTRPYLVRPICGFRPAQVLNPNIP